MENRRQLFDIRSSEEVRTSIPYLEAEESLSSRVRFIFLSLDTVDRIIIVRPMIHWHSTGRPINIPACAVVIGVAVMTINDNLSQKSYIFPRNEQSRLKVKMCNVTIK